MAVGAAGDHGHPAMEEQGLGTDSATTQHPAVMACRAWDWSRSPLTAFKSMLTSSDVSTESKIHKNLLYNRRIVCALCEKKGFHLNKIKKEHLQLLFYEEC